MATQTFLLRRNKQTKDRTKEVSEKTMFSSVDEIPYCGKAFSSGLSGQRSRVSRLCSLTSKGPHPALAHPQLEQKSREGMKSHTELHNFSTVEYPSSLRSTF